MVQVTDLGIHARLGIESAAVWVTGVSDGAPKPGASVTLYDKEGRVHAAGQTDDQGGEAGLHPGELSTEQRRAVESGDEDGPDQADHGAGPQS